jgi:hypothetical protein
MLIILAGSMLSLASPPTAAFFAAQDLTVRAPSGS